MAHKAQRSGSRSRPASPVSSSWPGANLQQNQADHAPARTSATLSSRLAVVDVAPLKIRVVIASFGPSDSRQAKVSPD